MEGEQLNWALDIIQKFLGLFVTLWEVILKTGKKKYIYTHKSFLGDNFIAFGIVHNASDT